MIGLNIGSGQRRFDNAHGWVNIDCVSRPPDQVPDLICDVGKERLPYEDGSVDVVVLHHVIEHFGCGEANALIAECYRVLKPSCRLFVFVPDIHKLAIRWLSNRLSDQLFFTNVYGAYQGQDGDRHRWGYRFASLVQYLEQAARWKQVSAFEHKTLPGADIAKDWWILGVECIK